MNAITTMLEKLPEYLSTFPIKMAESVAQAKIATVNVAKIESNGNHSDVD